MKQRDTEWSKNLVPYAMEMKRVLVLTGTSLYNNPFEIYNLLKIVRPDYMPDFIKFCCRYCDPVKRKNGVEFTGRSFH